MPSVRAPDPSAHPLPFRLLGSGRSYAKAAGLLISKGNYKKNHDKMRDFMNLVSSVTTIFFFIPQKR